MLSRRVLKAPRGDALVRRWNPRPFGDQEVISGDAQRGVVMEVPPAPTLEVPEPALLLQFLVDSLDAPAQLRQFYPAREADVFRNGRQPEF